MTKRIKLTQGKYALVDDEDFVELNKFKWFATRMSENYYAYRNIEGGKQMAMHRKIMSPPAGMRIDHINRNTLDNRRSNLRVCTASQNEANMPMRKSNSSGFKGVGWFERDNNWYACIKFNYKRIHLGYFKDKIEAAKAYDAKARELFGAFAFTNFNENIEK